MDDEKAQKLIIQGDCILIEDSARIEGTRVVLQHPLGYEPRAKHA